MTQALIVDIDGTLIDSNYQHVIAWLRAFRSEDVQAEAWTVHRYIGKGGDQMVASVAGQQVEQDLGDEIREAETEEFQKLIGEVEAFPGAASFIEEVSERGFEVVLASSAKASEVDHYLDLLGGDSALKGFTTSADVDATKPEPDLVDAALDKAGTREALMIGDSIWDIQAARKAGIGSYAVLTGGFSKAELEAGGAAEVRPALEDLLELLEEPSS